jgi:hypothetical protein
VASLCGGGRQAGWWWAHVIEHVKRCRACVVEQEERGGESHMTREIHQHMYLACKTYRQILGKLPTKIAED